MTGAAPDQNAPDRRRARRSARWGAPLLAAAALAAVNALTAYSLVLDRERLVQAAVESLDGESGVYEGFLRRAVAGMDEILLALGDRLRAGEAPEALKPTAAALASRSPLAEGISLAARGDTASEGDAIRCAPDAAGLTLQVDGATPGGRLTLCRTFGVGGGAGAGVTVAAAFGLSRLSHAMTGLKENWSSTLEGALADGRTLFVVPPSGAAPTAPVGGLRYDRGDGLTARSSSAPDGDGRLWLVSEHAVTGFPLALRVYSPFDRALTDWRRRATTIALTAGLASLFLIVCAVALARQAAARERLLDRLAESEAEATAIFDRTFHLMVLLELDGRIRRLNDVTRRAFGVASNDAIGRRIWETVWTELVVDRELAEFRLRAALEKAAGGGVARYETRVRRNPDDMEFAVFDVAVRPVLGADGAVRELLMEARDVTETTRARESLLRSERLAALGGLVAGIAHEVNTPVGVATTSASYLVREVEELRQLVAARKLTASRMQEFINNADEAARLTLSNCDRAAQIINSFKQVAVDQVGGERRRFALAEYLDEVLTSLRPRLKREPHKVEVDCPPDLVVETDPGALSHGLTNLLVNALVHAFAPGVVGAIRISARLQDGDMVKLTFSDNGRGIPAELHEQVFDPFFTTRRGSGGSGLGLHILHNAITVALRGQLRLVSEIGKGTTFVMTFPRVLSDYPPSGPMVGVEADQDKRVKNPAGENRPAAGRREQ